MNYGDLYGPAMKIQTQDIADAYFSDLVDATMSSHEEATGHKMSRILAESVVRKNLGYYAGYYDDETRERVERLFHTEHPIFGSIAKNGSPTPKEAFDMGVAWAEKAKINRHQQTNTK